MNQQNKKIPIIPPIIPPNFEEPKAPFKIELPKHRLEERIGYHMSRTVITLQRGEPLINAYKMMSRYNIGCLPIMDKSRVIGIVTDRILINSSSQRISVDTPIEKICVPVHTIRQNDSVSFAIAEMYRHHIRYLLVIERDKLKGLISQTDMLEASRRLLMKTYEHYKKAAKQATRDPLTGLFTRRIFDDIFSREFERSKRYGGLLAIIFLDLDHFKNINDRYGHPAGDLVLRYIGYLIRKTIRHVDTPFRYGGEEFVILMPESGTRAASIVAEKICARLEHQKFKSDSGLFSLTASAGICKRTDGFETPLDMLKVADHYLYEAKKNGRNRIEIAP